MMATILAELLADQEKKVYGDGFWRDVLMRLAARISVNRVVAGLHFPVDLAGGMVLGLQLGRYFVALAKGGKTELTGWKFDAQEYGKEDFPWRDILGLIDSGSGATSYLKPRKNTFVVPETDPARSPLCWLWAQATAEWRDTR